MGGWQEEIYYSMLYIARILNAPSSYIRAIEHSPNRGEAIIELITLYRELGQDENALFWAEKGLNLQPSTEYNLMYNPDIIVRQIPAIYEELKKGDRPTDIGMYLGHG